MEKKVFYRVCNPKTEQGLWYNFDGTFSGLIHDRFAFCKNSKLEMEFDPDLVGWLSATENVEDLFEWFTDEDLINLQMAGGWQIHKYEATNYRFYERFQHWVIEQVTSVQAGIVYFCI